MHQKWQQGCTTNDLSVCPKEILDYFASALKLVFYGRVFEQIYGLFRDSPPLLTRFFHQAAKQSGSPQPSDSE